MGRKTRISAGCKNVIVEPGCDGTVQQQKGIVFEFDQAYTFFRSQWVMVRDSDEKGFVKKNLVRQILISGRERPCQPDINLARGDRR